MYKVVFVGTSHFAVPALRAIGASAHELMAAIAPPDAPPRPGGQAVPVPVADAAERMGVPVHRFERPGAAAGLVGMLRPDFLVVCDYGHIVPRSLMRQPHFGCLNIHPSLLPRWRGAAPIERAILAGDETTGVSIMLMDTGLDSGPVLLSDTLEIGNETGGELRSTLADMGAQAIVRALDRFEELTPSPQDPGGITYAQKITSAEEVIDWGADSRQVRRKVRAFAPRPGARTNLGPTLLKVGEVVALDGKAPAPGAVVDVTKSMIVVGCGDGLAGIRRLQRAGGKMMGVRDFLNGFRLGVGARLGSPGSSVDRANPS